MLEPRTLMSGTVLASVVQDANANGVADAGEPGLAGWTVYVDVNGNGVNDAGDFAGVTDSTGHATIAGVPSKSFIVREILPAGYAPASGFKDFDHVSVKDNRVNNVSFLNVFTGTIGTIQGTVWNDVDHDGIRGAGDPGIPGWTVFLDLNGNRAFDAGEPSRVTDANGAYAFTGLAPGRYKVRDVTPSGWSPSTGLDGQVTVDISAGVTRTADFGNFFAASLATVVGNVWNDVNADGVRAAGDPGLGGWTVFLDLNGDGALGAGEPSTLTDLSGTYSFPSVTVGTYQLTEVLQPGWSLSPGHPQSVTLTVVNEGANRADFANFTPTLGSISGTVFNDADGNGFIGAGEPGLSGWTVFIDQDGDGAPGGGEPATTSDASGNYAFAGVAVGSAVVREIPGAGWTPTAPGTGMQLVTVQNASNVAGVNFGNKQRTDSAITGIAFADANGNGVRDAGETALSGIPVYLDLNNNGIQDAGEPVTTTAVDAFFTPAVDETGTYSFTHLGAGDYHVREVVPDTLSATPAAARDRFVSLGTGEQRDGVNFADVYRPNEIHGVVYDDANHNHVRDTGEAGIPGVTVYVDANRNNLADPAEQRTVTDADGAYSFTTNLRKGSYVIRALHHSGREHTYPTTTGGILLPDGVSNPPIGNVSPTSITTALAEGQTEHDTVSLTLPNAGALTNKVDVFLLFDDTGSFTSNSPIVRAAFPQIISTLQAALPGVDLGFGVGRFEEYANFAAELPTGRPFILNQPIISQDTPGFASAIQSALDRTAPGYGGDQPETDVEALYQMATGQGFDGNNNGTSTDSGAAGLGSTQVDPGPSGDVPAFNSFTADPSSNVLPPSGSIGGAGFRPGALPIILTATDTGFAFQPQGETSISGINGVTLPLSAFTQTSRPTTPFNNGAGIQQTVTALNALGALVIGLGTNGDANVDPRQGLEAFSTLTGAINRSATTIDNGTVDPIAPGDPLYFQISSGFGPSVANGITTAIENAVSTVDVNLAVRASDPRVHLTSNPGVINHVGSGQTATFDVTFTGDGGPHRFDLQFVRQGTNVVLGSIPVVMGTPIQGDGYEYVELEDGEIQHAEDFGDSFNALLPVNLAPSFGKGADQSATDTAGPQSLAGWATGITAGLGEDDAQVVDFVVSNDHSSLFASQPIVAPDGTLAFTPAPGASGTATVSVALHDSGGTDGGGQDTSAVQTFAISIVPGAATPMPTWISAAAGAAAWDAATHTLNVTGPATISADPGIADVAVIADGAAAALSIDAGPSAVVRLGTLKISNGAVVSLVSHGAAAISALVVNGNPTIDATSKLDLADNAMVVKNGSAAAVQSAITAGFNRGAWTGVGGITSSVAAADVLGLTALGYASNAELGRTNFAGVSGLTATDVLVRYTYYGDSDLNGKVTLDDFTQFLDGYQHAGNNWLVGDFDFNGKVSLDDFTQFQFGYLNQRSPLS